MLVVAVVSHGAGRRQGEGERRGLAAREKVWAAFGSSPEWKKLMSRPELSDALIVSNISNAILRPMPFSELR